MEPRLIFGLLVGASSLSNGFLTPTATTGLFWRCKSKHYQLKTRSLTQSLALRISVPGPGRESGDYEFTLPRV